VVFSVAVEVRLRPGIADPQGTTIERSLPTLGVTNVSDVTVGKSLRFRIDASDAETAGRQIDDLCERFLTNPVIETATVTLEPVGSDAAA
jgi:phosphoribosylformylglycinamidine synthase